MISTEGLRELYDSNYWARDQQLVVCARLSEEQLEQALGSSFGSLIATLKHLAGAEWVWLERFRGRNPRAVPWLKDTETLEALRARWDSIEADMRRYLAELKPEALAAPLTYQNLKGETWTYPLGQCLMPVLEYDASQHH